MIYKLEDLHYRYNGSDREVLRGVSLCVDEGELVTVLGRNGAGKSTLFGCMLGLLKPRSGTVSLCGREISSMSEREIAGVAAFVPQNDDPAFDFTVFEYVLMGCAANVGLFSHPGKAEEKSAWEALEQMELTELAWRLFNELSGGERRQATVARAIAAKPRVILFDEPTSHLDMGNQIKVLRIIRRLSQKGYAVAVTTHDPNHALMLGGTVAVLNGDGTVRRGKTDELLTEEVLAEVCGPGLCLRYMEEFDRKVCIYPEL